MQSKRMAKDYYLTNRVNDGAFFSLETTKVLDGDALDRGLTDMGWRYATSANTGFRVLVRAKGNRRWLNAWEDFVTDFEVREVETSVNAEGAIITKLGGKYPALPRLYALHGILGKIAVNK